ncbi:MAG TPA: DNA polymerase III subunit delta [Aestuariivirgaceae bacterium]|jgi:DNA polymerase-3 subunit delta
MAVLKTADFDRHLERGRLAATYLVYGSDPGKVGEIAQSLVRRVAGSLDDPFAVARFQDDAIAEDPHRLADEVFSRPMLGARKAVWVGNAGSAFLRAYEAMAEAPADGNVLIAEAGALPKSARLRSLLEKSRSAMVIPCYEDSVEDLERLIDEAGEEAGLAITPDARNALLGYLGENRALSRAEIDKLVLYCHGSGAIALADVEAVCSGGATGEISDLADAVFGGDLTNVDTLVDRLLKSDVSGSRLLSLASLHVRVLERLALEVASGASPAQAVRTARPPIFFSRQDSVLRQVRIWDGDTLSSAARSLASAIEQTRMFAVLEDQIAHRALLSLARWAAGSRFKN